MYTKEKTAPWLKWHSFYFIYPHDFMSLKPYKMLISLDIDKKGICKCCIFKEETDGGLILPCWDET